MFLVKWFQSVIQWLGLANKEARILFLGLDNAGKTTLLHMLRDNRVVQHPPTHHPTSEELVMGRITLKTYDLGGHEAARQLWNDYFTQVDGIVYIVDVADCNRVNETATEFDKLLKNDDIRDVPILVLGNKIDAPNALSEPIIRERLSLFQTTGKDTTVRFNGIRPIEIFMCSIVEREGYVEGFKWLSKYL